MGNEKNTPISLENPHSSPISDIMISEAAKAKSNDDSVGGTLEVFAKGLPLGLGGPLFDNLESKISRGRVTRNLTGGPGGLPWL